MEENHATLGALTQPDLCVGRRRQETQKRFLADLASMLFSMLSADSQLKSMRRMGKFLALNMQKAAHCHFE